MKSTEKIIALIDKGAPLPFLAEESLVETFNDFLKYGLIDIIDDKLILTSKGKEAKDLGIEKVIAELKVQEELKDFSVEIQKRESKLFRLCFGVCLTVLAVFLAISLTDCKLIF